MITDHDIEDLINSPRPSLYERAREAYFAAKDADEQAKLDQIEALKGEAWTMMGRLLGMTVAEIDPVYAALTHAHHNNETQRVEFGIDRWRFRIYYTFKPIKIANGQGESETIAQEDVPVYEFRHKSSSNWRKLTTLADLVDGTAVGSQR